MKKVFKFATGQPIPEGAVYLNTIKQTWLPVKDGLFQRCWLVWHYFLVEEDTNQDTKILPPRENPGD